MSLESLPFHDVVPLDHALFRPWGSIAVSRTIADAYNLRPVLGPKPWTRAVLTNGPLSSIPPMDLRILSSEERHAMTEAFGTTKDRGHNVLACFEANATPPRDAAARLDLLMNIDSFLEDDIPKLIALQDLKNTARRQAFQHSTKLLRAQIAGTAALTAIFDILAGMPTAVCPTLSLGATALIASEGIRRRQAKKLPPPITDLGAHQQHSRIIGVQAAEDFYLAYLGYRRIAGHPSLN